MNLGAKFYLKNIKSKLSLEFEFNSLNIKINSNDENILKLESHNSENNLIFETGILNIENSNDNELNLAVAQSIHHLLSLATGQEVIFDRQVYYNEGNPKEVREKMSAPSNEGEKIIPEFRLSRYLPQTLQKWIDLDKSQRDDLFIIINYLNQSKNGYIEDRILRTAQAWEALTMFRKIEVVLDDRLQDLRKDINKAYKNWRKTNGNSNIDPNGEIGNKIVSSIDQEKLMAKLYKLLIEFDINSSKLNLNLKELKRLRDSIAHTGKMDISGAKALNTLRPAVKGLQIILLLYLGYDGEIISEKDRWQTFETVKSFQNGAQQDQ